MSISRFLIALLVMAGVTYATRLLPLLFVRRPLRSRFLRSLLFYIPYAVLSAMTVPAIFYATGHLPSAIIGTAVAVLLAFWERSLITVAAGAAGAVLLAELLLLLLH